ncbi:MAG TPA: beta/gamma crystallin-related protein [Usitatibacter sp.]|nr:beta/gamma crystallin-related protein [Usitatibacter sp.]
MDATRFRACIALAACIVPAAPAAAGEITVYKQPHFGGEVLKLRGGAVDLARLGFHDQISSIVVHSGHWEFCTQPRFAGDCLVLEPGAYPALDTRINHRIESLRETSVVASATKEPLPPPVELFPSTRFQGKAVVLTGDMQTLHESGRAQRMSSLVVREGTWQLCSEPGFEGTCRVYEPGRYPDLERLDNQIGSIRRIGPPR